MSLNVQTRGSSNSRTNSDLVVRQIDPKAYRLYADWGPFVAMMRMMTHKSAMGNKSAMGGTLKAAKNIANAIGPKFEWVEKDPGTPYGLAQAEYAAGDLTVVVDKGEMFTVRDIIYVRTTGEQLLVTDISSDTLTVTRGFAGTTAAFIPSGERLILQANTFAEGTGSPSPIAWDPTAPFNYTQIFKKSTANTRTGLQTKEYGASNTMEELRRDVFEEFIQERARQYYFGEASIDVSGSTPVRTTGGLNSFITSNVTDMDGSFTYAKWMDFVDSFFRYGAMDKILFCSSEIMKNIQLEVLGNTEFAISPKSKEYGINVKRVTTAFGDVDIALDRTLNYYAEEGKGLGFVIEPKLISEVVLEADKWHPNVQDNDTDGREDQILGECGLKVCQQKRHAKLIL